MSARTAREAEAGPFEFRKIVLGALPAVLAGLGGFLVIYLLSEATIRFDVSLLIAPFGASCVLVFGLPQSPLAQPRNVIGGHLISSAIGLASLTLLGPTPLAFGIGVGIAIAAMLLSRTTHPPAGADPIVVILAGASWPFLLMPVLLGAVVIVAAGMIHHRLVTRAAYPAAQGE
ncbi:HPP family protein [Methylobacterium sp. C25]|uniref:HPP family protein n=1 Tax=Methylobacterium sp. C25 TaxID=2721622 RepID=UPI001F458567|nr:HPP family protein [Methylobacterium sp. C25]MCE4225662.1 HPP family protein [Methylobacterium sp. C25]